MKNRMNLHGGRKLKSVRLCPDSVANRKGSKAFPIQFLAGAFGVDVRRKEPYLVANGELDSLVLGVVILGLLILSGFDAFDEIVMEVAELLSERLRGRNWEIVASEIDGKGGMISVIGVEGGAIDAGLVGVVIGELGDR